jgi:hypothetical protein
VLTVDAAAGGFLHRLDLSDGRTVVAVARFRQDRSVAKDAPLFGMETTVRLSRQGFEDLIRVPVESTLTPPGAPASIGSV